MNILILGSGGREHALAWAIKQNPKCDTLFVAPGNAGIAGLATCIKLDILDGESIAKWSKDNDVELVIVGPEAPLAAGVADILRKHGIATFGPSQAAAQLEASKSFTKAVCDESRAPTARYARFDTAEAAKSYVQSEGAPIVIKADGLAAGKGVIVAMTLQEAMAALDDMFDGSFGEAGTEVVIEEFMEGEEASFFCLVNGTTILPIGTAQDHKRVGEGDTGPNTGGMGAYSPAPVMTDEVVQKTLDEIVRPTMGVMKTRGTPFQGVLFVGLMIKDGQPRLVEYNVRFGDPECQCLMMRLGGQVLDLIEATVENRLDDIQVHWAPDHALTVVMAAKGYPGAYQKGSIINGLDTMESDNNHAIFHAGTSLDNGEIIATGGRVLAVTGRGETLGDAHKRAYDMTRQIDWPDGFFRNDIGWRAL